MAGNANSGRKSEPAALKLLKGRGNGTDSGGRPVPKPPPFKRHAPERPAWLSPEAEREWDRVVPGLTMLDILKPEDRAVLAAYCETWSMYRVATEAVNQEGLTLLQETVIENARGTISTSKPIANPNVSIARAAGRELRAFAAQFGLSPTAEMALGKTGAPDDGDDDNPF